MDTLRKLLVPLFAMIFLCAALAVLSFVPKSELSAGSMSIWRTFLVSANTVTITIAGGLVLVTIAGVIVALWYGLTFAADNLFKVQTTRAGSIKAHNEAVLSRVRVDIAPADSQVLLTKPADSDLITDLAHLSPGRINGMTINYTELEMTRWQAWNMLHSTTRPAQIGPGSHPLMEQSYLPAPISLPETIRWSDLIPGHRGDLRNLVLGVKATSNGLMPVTVSLYDLFHTIAAASSGWGKSAFISSLLAQLATCYDGVEFVLIDQQAHGLAGFRDCSRLRYPILRQRGEILSALAEVYQEAIGLRSELLARYDADDLREYNERSGDYLPPIIVAVDEASALLTDKEIGAELKRQSWELRKFGVYQILALTSAKGTVIDTDHRQQFSSKVQLHANDRGQARLLMDAVQAVDFPKGRAVIDIAGHAPTTVQTPYITKQEIRALLGPGSEPPSAPPPMVVGDTESAADSKFRELVESGMSKSEASLKAYKRQYAGNLIARGKRALGEI